MTHKHLGIKDRAQIQEGLLKHESFAQIARRLNVSTSTISREVKNNRKRSILKGKNWNLCEHKRKCKKTNICGGCSIANCKSCAYSKKILKKRLVNFFNLVGYGKVLACK